MTKEKLYNYPRSYGDDLMPAMELAHFGYQTTITVHSLLFGDESVVYVTERRDGPEKEYLPDRGYVTIATLGATISGFHVEPSGLFKTFKSSKIRKIPISQREEVKNVVLRKLEKMFGSKIEDKSGRLGRVDYEPEIYGYGV